MKKKMLTILLSTALVASTMGTVAVTTYTASAESGPRTQTIKFGDLQSKTVAANYGLAEGTLVDYGVKTGKVGALKDYDTNNNGKLTSSAAPGAECQNWWWQATSADSVIVMFRFKADAVIDISSSKDIGGWLDQTTNIIVTLQSGETVTEVHKASPSTTDKSTVAYSGEVAAGDTLYYEFRTSADKRNIQSLQNITAEITENVADTVKEQKVSFGNLPKEVSQANYGSVTGDVADYSVKLGKTDNLHNFDGYSEYIDANGNCTGRRLTTTLDNVADKETPLANDVFCENWRWHASAANSIIVVFEFKVDAVVSISASGNIGGWIADTKIIVSLKSGETVAELQKETTSQQTVAYSGTVKAGDTLYYEFALNNGVGGTRNIQHTDLITATLTEDKVVAEEKTAEQYKADLEAYVATLNESDYAADQWTAIGGIVEGFLDVAGDKTGMLLKVEYEKQLNAIKAVPALAQQLKTQIEAYKAAFDKKVDALKAENFSKENYEKATALKAEFATAIDAAKTLESAKEINQDYIGRLNAIEAIKVSTSFLDLPDHTHEANFGLYKNMGIVEYGLKYGKVTSEIYDYDRYAADSSSIRLFTSEYGEKDVVAHNWCWIAVKERSVIAEFKALKDMSLTIASTRITNGGVPGWTVNTNITVYIQRGEDVKAIYSVNTPSADEQFGGTFYLKAGDILYYEFNTDHMSQPVNIQTPIETTMTADTTGFDQTKYEDQNNDLPQAVVEAVAAKLAELTTFVQGKTESNYSATNWAALQAIPEAFSAACETRLLRTSTVDDVNAIYNEFHAQAEAIETLTQAQDELVRYKTEKKEEVRKYADQMLNDNKYSKENKELIESYVTEAATSIDAATTKGAVNTAVTTAKNRINNVEISKGGCCSAVTTSAIAGFGVIVLALGGVILVRKTRKDQ